MFENRVLSGVFSPKREEVVGGWKNCIMRSFYTSSNNIRVIKPIIMRWEGHAE
jgi:hypothetical protein